MQRISVHQFFIVLAAVFLGTTFFPIAQIVIGEAGRAGWLAVFPGLFYGLPLMFLILSMTKNYPGKNLLQITDQVLGKWIGKGIGLAFTLISTYFGSLLLFQIAEVWERIVQPNVSNYIHVGGALIIIVFLSWVGIEVYARFTEVVFPLVVLTLLITLVLSIPRFEWDQYRPIIENGLMPILYASLAIESYTMEVVLFLTGFMAFLPQGKKEYKRLKNGIWIAFILVAFINTLVTFTEIMVFGPVEAQRLNYGILMLASMVQIARAIAGVESLFLIIWLGASIIKVGAFFYMSIWGLTHVFGIKNLFRWYVILGLIYFSVILYAPRAGLLFLELKMVSLYLLTPFALAWIPLVWGVSFYRRRWKK